jgi:hypothetical protein
LARLMAYQLIWIFADLASGFFFDRHLEHACGDINRNRDDPRPGLVQQDGAIAIARIPRVWFDSIFADSWPLSITATT